MKGWRKASARKKEIPQFRANNPAQLKVPRNTIRQAISDVYPKVEIIIYKHQ